MLSPSSERHRQHDDLVARRRLARLGELRDLLLRTGRQDVRVVDDAPGQVGHVGGEAASGASMNAASATIRMRQAYALIGRPRPRASSRRAARSLRGRRRRIRATQQRVERVEPAISASSARPSRRCGTIGGMRLPHSAAAMRPRSRCRRRPRRGARRRDQDQHADALARAEERRSRKNACANWHSTSARVRDRNSRANGAARRSSRERDAGADDHHGRQRDEKRRRRHPVGTQHVADRDDERGDRCASAPARHGSSG